MEEQWALFHSLCNPNDKDIERDTREQVLRRHIKPFEEQPFLRRLPPAPLAPPRRVYPFQLHLPGFFCASGGLS